MNTKIAQMDDETLTKELYFARACDIPMPEAQQWLRELEQEVSARADAELKESQ